MFVSKSCEKLNEKTKKKINPIFKIALLEMKLQNSLEKIRQNNNLIAPGQ